MGKVKKEPKVTNSPKQKVKKHILKTVPENKIKKIKKDTASKKLDKNIDSSKYEKCNVDINQVQRGVEALLQYTEKYKSNDLFKGQQQIFIQITCIRIPKSPTKKMRIKLKHPLITIDNEICLIVPDLKRGRKVDHEGTIEHYETLLKSKNVNFIKRIIPIRQIRVEYDQFELKRKLCGYYDYFLVDGRISGHVLHLLGKSFTEKRKTPVPIQLEAEDLNKVITKAMSKTELNIHPKGGSYIVQIGHTDMPVEHIIDNIKVIIDTLLSSFPGTWQNIRALHVKTEKSIAIPIYYTLRNANEVKPPVIKKSNVGIKITDELSTRNHKVTVYPDGRVTLNDPKLKKLEQKNKLKKQKVQNGKITKTKKTLKKKKIIKVKIEKGKKSPNKVKIEKENAPKVKTEAKTSVKVKSEKKSSVNKKIKLDK